MCYFKTPKKFYGVRVVLFLIRYQPIALWENIFGHIQYSLHSYNSRFSLFLSFKCSGWVCLWWSLVISFISPLLRHASINSSNCAGWKLQALRLCALEGGVLSVFLEALRVSYFILLYLFKLIINSFAICCIFLLHNVCGSKQEFYSINFYCLYSIFMT